MDFISVIVPIYKVEAYLDKCIASIVNQTYRNLEIILVDDGSPDNCGSICDAWANKDSRIQVIHKENGGLSDARNAGLLVATGDYISFIDSDDWVEPDFLARLYGAILDHGADIAECAVRFAYDDGTFGAIRGVYGEPTLDKIQSLYHLVMEDGVYQTVWNKLYRRAVIAGIPFEKGKCNEDDFWTYQVFDQIEKLTLVDAPLYNYLQRSGSIIGTGYTVRRLDGLEARVHRMRYLQKYPELANLTRQQLVYDCLWHLQSALRCLNVEEQETVLAQVRLILAEVRPVTFCVSFKQKVWGRLFITAPALTAKVRNGLKIGL